jgi:N4-gp56 family major capsid protein
MQNYNTAPGRNLIMAEREMLKKADPIKVLSSFGDQKQVPQNKTDTVVFRRPVPIDAGANGAPVVNASDYLMQEGTTPSSRSITYQDVQVTLQEYGVLMKLSSKAELLHEDDIPGDMIKLVGEHMGSIEEMIAYGTVRGGTNVVYGNGTSRPAVNTAVTLNKLRQVARTIESSHGKMVTEKLSAGVNFGTTPVEPAYLVFVHTDLSADIRNLPGFVPCVEYGSQQKAHERELGSVEEFRFITSPYFRPWLAAGGTVAAGAFLSNGGTTGTTADVYPMLVVGQNAWGQCALKGMGSIDPTYLPAKTKTHANPLGQFGYVGATFWKAAVRLNENWIVRVEVAATGL